VGTVTCQEINRRVILLMQDAGISVDPASGVGSGPLGITRENTQDNATLPNIRWTVEEILMWITDAQRATTLLRPNSNNVVAPVKLTSGIRQKLPTSGWLLLTANANMDAAGNYGRAVTLTSMDQMNRMFPNWRADPKGPVAYNYIYDLTDQKAFYVWPPNDGTGIVECNYAATPVEQTDMSQPIQLDDIFVPPLVDYCAMRASVKDAEFGPGLQYAAHFQQLFTMQLGGKDAGEKEQNPDAALPPASNR
jgi:hypothetical protein